MDIENFGYVADGEFLYKGALKKNWKQNQKKKDISSQEPTAR